jgi:hypothetical protein
MRVKRSPPPPERFLSHHAYHIFELDLASIAHALFGMKSLNASSADNAPRSPVPFGSQLTRLGRDANDRSFISP